MQNIVKKKVLCSAEKGSVIWAEPNSRSSAERLVGHYPLYKQKLKYALNFGNLYA